MAKFYSLYRDLVELLEPERRSSLKCARGFTVGLLSNHMGKEPYHLQIEQPPPLSPLIDLPKARPFLSDNNDSLFYPNQHH
jgi:hypothetical protein